MDDALDQNVVRKHVVNLWFLVTMHERKKDMILHLIFSLCVEMTRQHMPWLKHLWTSKVCWYVCW